MADRHLTARRGKLVESGLAGVAKDFQSPDRLSFLQFATKGHWGQFVVSLSHTI
jgi:hypothetical protein